MSGEKKVFDPGLGRLYRTRTKRVINRDGSFNVRRIGLRRQLYHRLLSMNNSRFYIWILISYVLCNVIFASIYVVLGVEGLGNSFNDLGIHDFLKAFFFSMQTFTTVGFGSIFPKYASANFVAGVEAMVGLLFFAIATGLVYGRFSKPSARILFSDTALISPYQESTNALMFRLVNRRENVLMEMKAQVMLTMDVDESEGVRRRYYKLDLETPDILFFPLTWTVVHPVNTKSPLLGLSHQDLIDRDAEILILVNGFDETFGQQVHVRFSYTADEIVWGGKFERNFFTDDDGEITLDIDKVHVYKKAPLH